MRISQVKGKLLLFGVVSKMKPEKSETLYKQAEKALQDSPRQIQDRSIWLTTGRVIR